MKKNLILLFLLLCISNAYSLNITPGGGGGIVIGSTSFPFGICLKLGLYFDDFLNISLLSGVAPMSTGVYGGIAIEYNISNIILHSSITTNVINITYNPGFGIILGKIDDGTIRSSYMTHKLILTYSINIMTYSDQYKHMSDQINSWTHGMSIIYTLDG